VPSIQQEVQDLDPAKVLNKRTRSGKSAETSQPQSAHLTISKKKRKIAIKKLKEASLVEEDSHQETEGRKLQKKLLCRKLRKLLRRLVLLLNN